MNINSNGALFRTLLVIAFCAIMVCSLAGCGGGDDATSDAGGDQTQTASEEKAAEDSSEGAASGTAGIDVDLTALSSTMVYSEVNDMMVSPENYKGKTVKMSGPSSSFHDEEKDKYYYACIIEDATACCQQGIEYELTGDYKLPDDYPKDEEKITVVGTFDTYKEGDATYCVLKDAKLQ